MKSFTIESVSNASAQLFPNITPNSFTNNLPGQLNPECHWEVAVSKISYPSVYQNHSEGKFRFFDKKLSKSSSFHYFEPGLYPSFTDNVETINTLIQERHNHSESCVAVEVPRRTQNCDAHLANEGSGIAFFKMDLGNFFGSFFGHEFGVMLRGKGLHKPKFAYDIVLIHSVMIYTDLTEYNFVGYTKAPLLRCFLFFPELKVGDIITTGQYRNNQTVVTYKLDRCSKIHFIVFRLTWKTRPVKKKPFVSPRVIRFVLKFRKASSNLFSHKHVTRWLFQDTWKIPFKRGVGR